ncbi:MAG: hypothetical protein E7361_03515 [Clostridiales bacterium]|nr:hypothetical protein [Clostridiales bacterium]
MNNSKNLKEFFANTKKRYSGKFGPAFFATIISLLPFAIIFALSAWLAVKVNTLFAIIALVAIVIFGNMQIGHIRFMRELAVSDTRPKYSLLFSGFTGKNMLMYMFLGVVIFVIYLFSAIFLIVPLFFAIGAFSMVFHFVEHHNYDNFLDALSTSEKRMRRQKGNMFAYKALFYIAYFVIAVLLAIAVVYIGRIEATLVATLLTCLVIVLLFIAFSAVFTIFSMCNHNFFAEVLDYAERRARRTSMVVETTVQPKADEAKLEKVQSQPKSVAPKATAKKPAPKTTKKD